MSEFRKLVENVLKEYYTKEGHWTNDPQDDYDYDNEYEDWLEKQDYLEGYAVCLGKDEKGNDLFASADKSVSGEPSYEPTTAIYVDKYINDPDLPAFFEYSWDNKSKEEAKRKAEEFANEWKQHFPNAQTEIVEVYARPEDGYEFYRTKEEVYPIEDFDYGQYMADKREAEAEMEWEERREMESYWRHHGMNEE